MDDLAALISSVTAVLATVVTLFLLRQGQVGQRELRHNHERAQAQQLTAWADWHTGSMRGDREEARTPAIYVANYSEAVVYDVFVDYRTPIEGAEVRAAIGPVPPGERRCLEIDYTGEIDAQWEPAALFARVYFRDAAGRLWLRDPLGASGPTTVPATTQRRPGMHRPSGHRATTR